MSFCYRIPFEESFEDLKEGDEVTFETEETEKDGQKRINAVNPNKKF